MRLDFDFYTILEFRLCNRGDHFLLLSMYLVCVWQVPSQVSYESFWQRYFYKVQLFQQVSDVL